MRHYETLYETLNKDDREFVEMFTSRIINDLDFDVSDFVFEGGITKEKLLLLLTKEVTQLKKLQKSGETALKIIH